MSAAEHSAGDNGPALFTAVAHNASGSSGESWIEGGLRVSVASPLAGPAEGATNPEELLALSWATCLNAAARVVAGAGVDVEASVTISLHRRSGDDGFEFSGHARLRFAGTPAAEAERLAAAAHARCPVSRMLSGASTVTVSAQT